MGPTAEKRREPGQRVGIQPQPPATATADDGGTAVVEDVATSTL